ncbi:hypothetical protein NC651_033852 [Populus alba x Populus x berolinensis]|nr:hypothetical protein NC651_033852 [Populus alba x Populus x berolinensis]
MLLFGHGFLINWLCVVCFGLQGLLSLFGNIYAWRELCCSQPSVMLLFMFLVASLPHYFFFFLFFFKTYRWLSSSKLLQLHTSTHSIKLASNCSQTPLSFRYS